MHQLLCVLSAPELSGSCSAPPVCGCIVLLFNLLMFVWQYITAIMKSYVSKV